MSEPFELHLCLRDESGNETGEVVALEVNLIDEAGYDCLLELSCLDFDEEDGVRGNEIFFGPRCFTLHGSTFEFIGSRAQHVGNICWDAVKMHPDELARLLNVLRRNDWDCDTGEASLFEAWNAGLDFTPDLLEARA